MQVQLSCKYAAQYNLIQIHFAVFQWMVENHCAVFQYNLTPSCVIQKIWCLRYIGFYIKVCCTSIQTHECGAPIQLKPDAWLLTSILILSKEACPIQWLNTNCSPSNSVKSPSFTIQHKCKYTCIHTCSISVQFTYIPVYPCTICSIYIMSSRACICISYHLCTSDHACSLTNLALSHLHPFEESSQRQSPS